MFLFHKCAELHCQAGHGLHFGSTVEGLLWWLPPSQWLLGAAATRKSKLVRMIEVRRVLLTVTTAITRPPSVGGGIALVLAGRTVMTSPLTEPVTVLLFSDTLR